MRRFPAVITVAVLTLAACGGGDDDGDAAPETGPVESGNNPSDSSDTPIVTTSEAPDPTVADVVEESPAEEPEPADTTPADTTPADTTPADTEPADTAPAGDDGVVAVVLNEFAVETPTTLAAGVTTFAIVNEGQFPHHFSIARGDSYETLPQLGNGAIDEETLGDDFLGGTENLDGGGETTIEFDLSPGNYVFFCNIVAGPTSHASRGQVLSVTVG